MTEGVHFLDARAPEGMRLYAIGDIHGRRDLIERMHGAIGEDLARDPPTDWRIIHLGDYTDRGPDTKGVLDFLVAAGKRDSRVLSIAGNHDVGMLEFLDRPDIDSLFAHFAWLRLIRDRFGVEVRFPIIEDPTMVIANAYGMVMKGDRDSAAVRSTYFIDPEGTIQATTCYPSTVGRSVPEILRTLDALQAVRSKGTLAPANWQAGERMLRPPETDIDAIFSSDNEVDWFYRETKA